MPAFPRISGLLALLLTSVAWAASPTLLEPKALPPTKAAPDYASFAAMQGLPASGASSGSWTTLAAQPPLLDYVDCGPGTPVLLTDGTVLVADAGCQDWWKLTPDAFGSYVNGTWSQIASLPAGYAPLYHATAVLPDGRVVIEGGEYNLLNAAWTNQGAIYDPLADTWTPVNPPAGWTTIGDAPGTVLANGTFMLGNCCTTDQALFNPRTLSWTATGAGKYDVNNEEGWTLLPGGNVLTVDAYVPVNIPYLPGGTNSEIYDAHSGTWKSAGSTVVQLWDSWNACGQLSLEPNAGPSFEVGPGVLRPDGTVFYVGSNTCGPGFSGATAIYDTRRHSWKAGPSLPDTLNEADGPAVLEPNGKVLFLASPGFGGTPTSYFEWNGESLKAAPPSPNAALESSFYGNFLVLPTGQILMTDFISVTLYSPGGSPRPEWAPQIVSAPDRVHAGGSYEISGVLFNGMSQGAAYGDDQQAATNFPLVRITNKATGHVFYSRTHHHSSMAVASDDIVTTHFTVPAGQENGPSRLEVVANGIASRPLDIYVGD